MLIYISRLGMLGDTLFIVPALKNIRQAYPDATIVAIVSPVGKAIIEETGLIDNLYVHNIYYPKISAFFLSRRLRDVQPDLYFNFDASEAYHQLFSSMFSAKQTYRMVPELTHDHTIQVKQQSGEHLKDHIVDQYLSLVEKANIPIKDASYVMPNTSAKTLRYRHQFHKKLAPHGRQFISIHAGNHVFNTNKLFKKLGFVPRAWSLPYYCSLAEKLATSYPDACIVLTGGFYEKSMAATIESHLKTKNLPVINMAGKTKNTHAFLGLLSNMSMMFCGDTGPMHLSSALKVPLVAIFCSADPADTGPKGHSDYYTVVSSDLDCDPCVHRPHEFQCPAHTNCVKSLTPSLVLEKSAGFRQKHLK